MRSSRAERVTADYEVFSPMFEGPGSPELARELQEELASCSFQVVLVDRDAAVGLLRHKKTPRSSRMELNRRRRRMTDG